MSDHLPECGRYCDGKPPKCRGGDCTLCDEVDCICTALRACEQRVRQDMALQYLVSDREQQEAEQRAYAAGVAAARDAVADCRVPWPTATGDLVNEGIDDALAAIDGLRSPLTTPVAPAAAIEGGPSNPLPPNSGLAATGGALPVSGALGGGLAEVVGVSSVGPHTHKTHGKGDPQRHSEDFLAGLSAARDAVAALRGVGSFVDGVGNVVSRTAALAAIDALGGESND